MSGYLARALLASCLALASGCIHVPAQSVAVDRFDYGQALSDSWKEQTLANVVRLRYADAPAFLEVGSVINGYSRSNTVNVNADVPLSGSDANLASAGGSSTWSNSPTITYQPVTGDSFAKSLLRPIPPESVLQLIQSGWRVGLILNVTVSAVNGIRNPSLVSGAPQDPRFGQLTDALGRIQQAGAMGYRVEKAQDSEGVKLLLNEQERSEVRADSEIVRQLLGLDAGVKVLDVHFGMVPKDGQELAFVTRSMLEIMLETGTGIEVPQAHREQKRVLYPPSAADAGYLRLVRIRSGLEHPAESYAAIKYKGYWFWIDDNDVQSKGVFTFLMMLFSMAESGHASAPPLISIGVGH